MKFSKNFLTALLISVSLAAGSLQASEIGVFLGGYSRESDIDRIQNLSYDRSFAGYFGLDWAHRFIIPLFELEHTLGVALGADKSARPNTFVYSTNFHVILPVALLRVKPFVGAGLGYVYNFGEKAELKDVAGFLGKTGNFQLNLGGGAKVKLSDNWWLRLSLRDYILVGCKQAIKEIAETGEVFSSVENATHNISVTASVAFSY